MTPVRRFLSARAHSPASLIKLEHRGVALIAVLWIVVALSISVTGMSHGVRDEARLMNVARQEVQAQALGDAAIHIVLQTLVANGKPLEQMEQTAVVYRGVSMSVQAMPLNGLIDINSASPMLLERLLTVAGGMAPQAAQAMAQAIVQARETRDAKGAPQRFEAEEDLMRVPGMGYDLYARLAALLTADVRGAGKVNPMAAPVEVLNVLAGGNAGVAARIASSRSANRVGVDTAGLDGALLDSSIVRRIRITAYVPMADGSVIRTSRSVDFGTRVNEGLPWHTFRVASGVEPGQR